MIPYLFKMAVLTLKSGIYIRYAKVLGRVGYVSICSNKNLHLITLVLVFGCAVCVQIFVLLCCFILNRPFNIVTSE